MTNPIDGSSIRPVLLAFLAGRSPGAWNSAAIMTRINKSRLIDGIVSIETVEQELRVMANPRFGWVDVQVDPTSQEIVWFATESGVKRWALDGSMYVGG